MKDIPERFQKIFKQHIASKSVDKVSKLKPFLTIFLALIQNKDALAELEALIETILEEDPSAKKVNSFKTKLKIGRELRMSAQIGDYDMDSIILDLGSNVNIRF